MPGPATGWMAPSAAGDGARELLAHEVLARHEVGVAAEQDVGAAAGHVGGDGDHAEASGLRDDLRFLLVELGVEHDVAHALALEDLGEQLGFLDGGGADQRGLLRCVQARDLIGDREVLSPCAVRKTTSGFSMRCILRLVGVTTMSSL